MISPKDFYSSLKEYGIQFFVGVPDSLLAEFCAFLEESGTPGNHLIAANEGNAIGVAIGYYISTGSLAAVYMQNSGLGNAINPLLSLSDKKIFGVPLLLIIGWRGEPGVNDEPQHISQGEKTLDLLTLLDIPYKVIDGESDYQSAIRLMTRESQKTSRPVALVVRKNTFSGEETSSTTAACSLLSREGAIKILLELLEENDVVVSTTGKTSREVFEVKRGSKSSINEFMTVGGMGHASSIALGVALGLQGKRKVICLDGDGALIMHMGSLPVISKAKPKGFVHVLLNNGVHDSVGGQETASDNIEYRELALATGYRAYEFADDQPSLIRGWNSLLLEPGPTFFEIKIKSGSRSDLGRPTMTPKGNMERFMKTLGVYDE